jgi:crotonobetainyl-CoA:carnitine CoA-transferase CaiB-like acyl-CoA transferase
MARRVYYDTDKRSITLRTDTVRGRDLLATLISRSSVVIESHPPGTLESIGLGYDRLRADHPQLTMVSITPFGQSGPYSAYKADDLIAFAMGGLMFISGTPDRPPVVGPLEQAFVVAGVHAATLALAAAWSASRTGTGAWVDVSMMECLAAQECTITNFRGDDEYTRRAGSQHRAASPGRIFPCRDGFVHIFVSQDPAVWTRFVEWLGSPAELAEPELADIQNRLAHSTAINDATQRFTRTQTRKELTSTGQAMHLPVVPVYAVDEALQDEQVRYLEVLELAELPTGGAPYRTLVPPLGRGRPPTERRGAPPIGHDTAAVLAEAGISDEEYTQLREAGVV